MADEVKEAALGNIPNIQKKITNVEKYNYTIQDFNLFTILSKLPDVNTERVQKIANMIKDQNLITLVKQYSDKVKSTTSSNGQKANKQYTINELNGKTKCYLNETLQKDYLQLVVEDDGDCLFYALSIILMSTPIYYNDIKVVLLIVYYIIFTVKDTNIDYATVITFLLPIQNKLGSIPHEGNITIDNEKNTYLIRFYALLSYYLTKNKGKGEDEQKKIQNAVKHIFIPATSNMNSLYTQLLGNSTNLTYGTLEDILVFEQLFTPIEIVTNTTKSIDPAKDLLFNCKLRIKNEANSAGNHFNLLVKKPISIQNGINTQNGIITKYGNATRISEGYYILNTQLAETDRPPSPAPADAPQTRRRRTALRRARGGAGACRCSSACPSCR
jgi:hypothetical protein